MTDDERSVVVRRVAHAEHEVTNGRGGTLRIGTGGSADFTPVELLLAAIAACTGLDVDFITTRRAEPEHFEVTASGRKVRDEHGNRMVDLAVRFSVRFPDGPEGDEARDVLPSAVQRSHDRLCTVSRTVEVASPIAVSVADPG